MNPSSSDTDVYSQAGDWLMGTARRNPEGLLLLAAGCALLLRSGRGSTRSSNDYSPRSNFSNTNRSSSGMSNMSGVADAASNLRNGLSNTAEMASDYAADLKDRASDVAGSYADSVSDFAGDARRAVSEGTDRIRRQAQNTLQSTQNTLQSTMDRVLRDQPLAVAMIGIAAGAAVAAAFPATDIENRVLGGTHEALSDAVDQASKTVIGAASQAGERLKSAAADRGLTADGLKGLASEVAESFTDAVAGKSENKSDDRGGNKAANKFGSSSAQSSAASAGATGGSKSNTASANPSKPTTSWPQDGSNR